MIKTDFNIVDNRTYNYKTEPIHISSAIEQWRKEIADKH